MTLHQGAALYRQHDTVDVLNNHWIIGKPISKEHPLVTYVDVRKIIMKKSTINSWEGGTTVLEHGREVLW